MEIRQQIQSDLLNQEVALSTILRKAKVLASQLRSEELSNWVSQELDSYKSNDNLPDYRVISTGCFGTWTNGYWIVKGRGVPLSKVKDLQLKKALTEFSVREGIRTVEQHAAGSDVRFGLSADITSWVNHYVGEDGYGYAEIQYAIGGYEFAQILDTVRNRLLDFVLKLDENWFAEDNPPSKDALSALVSVVIYNNPQGGRMAVFDQRGQQVQYQYNAAGDVNISAVQSKHELAKELERLSGEIERAKDSGVISGDVAVEAEYHLVQAVKEARKETPHEESFLNHIITAKGLLDHVAAVAGLVTSLAKVAEIASTIFR